MLGGRSGRGKVNSYIKLLYTINGKSISATRATAIAFCEPTFSGPSASQVFFITDAPRGRPVREPGAIDDF